MKKSYYEKLQKDNVLLLDSFYINLFGILGLLQLNENSALLQNYFRKNMNARVDYIDPKHFSELYVAIQMLKENGYLRWWIASDLLKMLNGIKFGKEDYISSDELRKILKQVVLFSIRFSPRIEVLVRKFMGSSLDLEEMVKPMFMNAFIMGNSKEFVSMAKILEREPDFIF